MFDVNDWYWHVGGDTTRVFSSKRNAYVSKMDPDFTQWLTTGGVGAPVPIGSELDLWHYMQPLVPEWMYISSNDTFAKPTPDTYHPEQLMNYNAFREWETENGGMVAGGVPIRTDDRSKQPVLNAKELAEADPAYTTNWVGADGAVYPLNATQIIEMANDLEAFLAACMLTYATIDGGISARTVLTTDYIDSQYAAIPKGGDMPAKAAKRIARKNPWW